MVLAILAAISLSAVIGEDGIIFQAKDTKNMIENETQYDNAQLASMQGDLRDNSIYSGIGIVPGTDLGGSSEGGEGGSSGSGGNSHGGSNTGGTNTNTGSSDGSMIGGDAIPPTIRVIEGEEVAASFFRSDVTIQIATTDKTLKVKYILTTTIPEINEELYPSGLIREMDIENGGTLTFTKDGEYTVTAYTYDLQGKKSNSTVMWLKRETGAAAGNGVTASIISGNGGNAETHGWYTSNVTIRVLGTDSGSARVTYRVKGTAYSNGYIGNEEYSIGAIDTGEVDIANGTTFKVALDGNFSVVAYTYDNGGTRLSTAPTINLKRDSSRPIVTLYKGEQIVGTGFQVTFNSQDMASGLSTTDKNIYYHKVASGLTYTSIKSQNETQIYTEVEHNLQKDKTYDMYGVVKDEAGNMAATNVISRPAIWVSNGPTKSSDSGVDGAREFYNGDIQISLTGQDENNVDILRTTYQIEGTTTGAGTIDNINYNPANAVPSDERTISNNNSVTFPIGADGNWVVKVHTYNKENLRVSTNTLEVTVDKVTPEPPTIEVTGGTEHESTYYSDDITIKVTGVDDTCFKKVTYVVTSVGKSTGSGTIGSTSISNNQTVNIPETDITNGGTFKIQADGRYKIQGYTYDKAGRKSAIATGIEVTRDTVNPIANAPTVKTGTQGEAGYYRSNVTMQMNGYTEATSYKKMTYRVTGKVVKVGKIGATDVSLNQNVDTGEVEIASDGTFDITADGTWTVTAKCYDKTGKTGTNVLVITKDTEKPTISNFICTDNPLQYTSISVSVVASDNAGGCGIGVVRDTYVYYIGDTNVASLADNTFKYINLTQDTEYELYTTVKDKAGNVSDKKLLSITTDWNMKNIPYTGTVQVLNLKPATYKLEVWGAQGGGNGDGVGLGGYSYGNYVVTTNMDIYIYVGGQGTVYGGGYNGGGGGSNGGGGASDIRTVEGDLNSRIIVAGGGGGLGKWRNTANGGAGGGTSGSKGADGYSKDNGYSSTSYGGNGGTNSAGGAAGGVSSGGTSYLGTAGSFGVGGSGGMGGGGGGGWYGGGAGGAGSSGGSTAGGGGGSGYIGKVTSGSMSSGIQSGNGMARITLIE